MIRILIADAQYLIRVGLTNLLASVKDFNVIGEASNSKELLFLTKEHHPDVIIFDYKSEKYFSQEDIQLVKRISPTTNFLVISDDNSKPSIYSAIEKGVISFLTKECDKEEIIGAIYATAKNEKFLCHKVIDIIIEKH